VSGIAKPSRNGLKTNELMLVKVVVEAAMEEAKKKKNIDLLMLLTTNKISNEWLAYYLMIQLSSCKEAFSPGNFCILLKTTKENLDNLDYIEVMEELIDSKDICPKREGGRSKKTRRIKKSNRRSAKNKL
jgi:hypothetical protein